jgi:FtsX-like permease family
VLDGDLRQPREDARVPPPKGRHVKRAGRRLRAPLVVVAARLRARRGAALLVVVGVAAAVGMLEGAFGASVAMRDDVARRALAALAPGDRSFRVDAFGLEPGQTYRQVDRGVRRALAGIAPGHVLRGEFLHPLRLGVGVVRLAGVDEPQRVFRLRTGRWPRTCTPRRCEVLQLGGGGPAVRRAPGIVLVRVGTVPASATAFGDAMQPSADAVVDVAAGATTLDTLPALDGIYRSYSWVEPVDPRRLHVWDIGRTLARETRAQSAVAPYGDTFRLSGPDDALLAARSRGRVGAERLVLLGGELSALLLGFALVAAVGLRAGLAAERRRLLARGASPVQVTLAVVAELATVTAAGVVVGVVAASLALWRSSGGGVLAHALATPAAVLALVVVWLVASAAAFAAARAEPQERPRRVRPLDVAAVGAVAAVALAFARGGLSASAPSKGDTTLLLLVPVLSCFAAAVAGARLLGPLVRAGELVARRGPLVVRLALLGVARAPARTLASFAFLLVSVALALFAVSYRATLGRSAHDEAAFSVPLDYTISEGARLVEPLQAAPLARYERLAPAVRAYPVVRQSADVAGPGTSTLSPTVLGLPPAALARLHWRADFAASGPRELARSIATGGPVRLRTAALPPSARTLSLRVRIRGAPVGLRLLGLDAAGGPITAALGERTAGAWTLTARRPKQLRSILGLEVSLASAEQVSVSHRAAEGEVATVPHGSLGLGPLVAGGRTVTRWQDWVARGDATVRAGATVRFAYSFGTDETALLRPREPTDGVPLRVVASPAIAGAAGPGGRITLDFQLTRVPARIVAVAARFPDAEQQDEGFVIADESRLATALNADAPGLGAARELWVATPPGARAAVGDALARPPFSALAVASRAQLEHALRDDPLALALAAMLAAAAAVALALAVLGFWVAAAGELRDETRTLFDLEAQGVAPRELRRQFRLRAATVAALATAAGIALGWLLSRAAVALVRISAVGATPQPPLRLDEAWLLVVVAAAAFLVACAIVLELSVRRFFRGATPPRASWSLG